MNRDTLGPVVGKENKMPPIDLAYAAAHRIMTEQPPYTDLATPGARLSAKLDHIAGIIKQTYEGARG